MGKENTAIIAGSTGLVGGHLLQFLLNDSRYSKIVSLVRKKQNISHPKLEQIVFDFDDEKAYQALPEAEAIYCTLGTTIKKAGGKDNFIKVDHEYPLKLAKHGKEKGVKLFSIVTAIGSDADSIVFYNKVKGTVERDITALKFNTLHIFQPSLLVGNRQEFRAGEKAAEFFMNVFNPLFTGNLRKYRSIKAEDVAKAMIVAQNEGLHIYLSDEIQDLADSSNL